MQDAYNPSAYSGIDEETGEDLRTPHFTSEIDIIDPRRPPAHIAALGIRQGMPLDELSARTATLTSYIGVPQEELEGYINRNIRIIGCMIYRVDYFTSKETGNREPGYDVVLVKLEETSKNGQHIIVACHAKQVFELARNVWIPFIGWYDWNGVLEYFVTRSKKGYHLQEVLKTSPTTVSPLP